MIGILSVIGMVLSLMTGGCAAAHVEEIKDTKLFGKIPLFAIGFFGYGLIAATALSTMLFFVVTNHLLIAIAAIFTVHLVRKAIQIRLGCPLCPFIWLLNVVLVGVVIASYLHKA